MINFNRIENISDENKILYSWIYPEFPIRWIPNCVVLTDYRTNKERIIAAGVDSNIMLELAAEFEKSFSNRDTNWSYDNSQCIFYFKSNEELLSFLLICK